MADLLAPSPQNPKYYFLKTVPLLVLLLAVNSLAQNPVARQVTRQRLMWLKWDSRIYFHPRWFVRAEFEERRYIFPDAQHHFITHLAQYHILSDKWQIGGRISYSLQSPHDPRASSRLVVPEWRPGIVLVNRVLLNNRLTLNHQYRLEYRMIHNATGAELLPGYQRIFRFRYRAELNYYLLKKPGEPGSLRLRVSDEVMLNAGKGIVYHVFDQNRIYTGLNYQATKNFAFEMAYLKWFQQRASGYQYFNRDIFRFIIQHQLRLYRTEKPG